MCQFRRDPADESRHLDRAAELSLASHQEELQRRARSLNAAILTCDADNEDLAKLEMFKSTRARELLASGSAAAVQYFEQHPQWSNCFSEVPVPTKLPLSMSPKSFKAARLGLGQLLLAEHSFSNAFPEAMPALARRVAQDIDEFEATGEAIATFIQDAAAAVCRGLATRPEGGRKHPSERVAMSRSPFTWQ